MIERKLTVSFGGMHQAKIAHVKQLAWREFAKWLTEVPPQVVDKAERGWYCPTEFDPTYRDSDNFVARHAITFDFDHVFKDTWDKVLETWGGLAFAMYTTWSHSSSKPRFRVVMPLSRPAGYDEYQAVVRKVATDMDIELIARESFVPAQFMYCPARATDAAVDAAVKNEAAKVRPDGSFKARINEGPWLDVDEVLAEYENWADHRTWPHRRDADGVHAIKAEQTRPDEKPGIVGDFCRALSIEDVIERFGLPYAKVR